MPRLQYLCWVTCVLHSRAPYGGWHAFCSHLKPSGVLQSMCRHAMAAAALEPDWQRKKKEQLQQQDGGSSSSSSVAWQYPPVAAALLASSAVSILYTLRALTATSSADIAHRLAVFSALASDRAVLDLLLVAADSLLALYPQQQQQQQQPALPPCGSAAALRPLPLALRCEYDITTEPAMLYEGLGLHEPPSPEVARLRGNQCFRYQDYELAAHYYSLALEMKPGVSRVCGGLCVSLVCARPVCARPLRDRLAG